MEQQKNYYELLGVPRNASVDAIKEAYKELAKIFHPDSNFFSEIISAPLTGEALKTFQALTAAYSTLVHGEKRREYDATLPPELGDWDERVDNEFHTEMRMRTLTNEDGAKRPPALRSFGTVDSEPVISEEEDREEGEREAPVAGLGSALKKLFGRR